MGYYVRVFCKSDRVPSVRQVLGHLNSLDFYFDVETGLRPEEQESPGWTQFELKYDEERTPIRVECNRVAGSDGVAKEEIAEFIELVEAGSPGGHEAKVLDHLRQAKYVVACELPVSDMDDDGYELNGEFMRFFVEHHEGMIHADGEGFYSGSEIIVETD